MSGGVDSSVAALELRDAGHEVIGLFLRNGISKPIGLGAKTHRQGCCSLDDARDADAVARALGIPFYVIDYAAEFGAIIDGFVEAYRRGRTPNPCVVCNRDLKFGSLVSFARTLGAERVATGHYARLESGRLRRGVDRAKDQSYVLAAVKPDGLADAIFPLGALTKPQVRERARRAGLPVAEKRESQEICFVPSNDYRDLLDSRGVPGTPGPIVREGGAIVGEHAGYERFTVGQRRGLGVAAEQPLYVTSIDPATATVTIGPRDALATAWLESDDANWFDSQLSEPGSERRFFVQLRAHHEAAPARVVARERGVRVEFESPEAGVAPGQLAVFYDGEGTVAGSCWIERTG